MLAKYTFKQVIYAALYALISTIVSASLLQVILDFEHYQMSGFWRGMGAASTYFLFLLLWLPKEGLHE